MAYITKLKQLVSIKPDPRSETEITVDYTLLNTDRNILCLAGLVLTIPVLSNITHYEDISILNSSSSNVTITSVELLGDTNSIILYPHEAVTLIKGTIKYLIK